MKLKFLADANISPDLWRAMHRREPALDFAGHQGILPDGTPDHEVLGIASSLDRVLVTLDVHTMQQHFNRFVIERDSPGVLLIPSRRSTASVLESLLFVWLYWRPEQLRNQLIWLPRIDSPIDELT